jgi:NitT/TauT family transport system permease protein
MRRIADLKGALLGLVISLILWEVTARLLSMPAVPSPVDVLPLFASSLFGELGFHFLASTGRVLAAIALAVITAVPAGLALGQFQGLNRVVSPLIAILYPIPKIVFLPVIFLLMGITDFSKIFLIALIVFFQILVVVRDEAVNIPQELLLSVRSLGAGRRAIFRYVYLPASVPAVLTALRVSVGIAVAVLFIAEQSLTTYGLGYYIVVETYQVLMYKEMYAGILGMGLLGLALYFIIHGFEKRYTRHLSIR